MDYIIFIQKCYSKRAIWLIGKVYGDTEAQKTSCVQVYLSLQLYNTEIKADSKINKSTSFINPCPAMPGYIWG